jgi:hypothetical protein
MPESQNQTQTLSEPVAEQLAVLGDGFQNPIATNRSNCGPKTTTQTITYRYWFDW